MKNRAVLQAALAVAIAAGFLAGRACANEQRTNMSENATVDEKFNLIIVWLNMIDRIGPEGFVIASNLRELPDRTRVQRDSETWCGRFLKPAVNPHNLTLKPRLSIHRSTTDTADVLSYESAAGGLGFRVYETVDFVLLRIEQMQPDLLSLAEDKTPGAIVSVAEATLNMRGTALTALGREKQYNWVFTFTRPVKEGSHFSTDASKDPHTMSSWADRVDGGIHNKHLYFMCFKRRESGDGKLVLLDSHHWFDGRCWSAY